MLPVAQQTLVKDRDTVDDFHPTLQQLESRNVSIEVGICDCANT